MAVERIEMKHPDPDEKGVNVEKSKYDFLKPRIVEAIKKLQPLTPTDLFNYMTEHHAADFDGKIGWYTEGMKLDLEARGIIKHDRKTRKITLL